MRVQFGDCLLCFQRFHIQDSYFPHCHRVNNNIVCIWAFEWHKTRFYMHCFSFADRPSSKKLVCKRKMSEIDLKKKSWKTLTFFIFWAVMFSVLNLWKNWRNKNDPERGRHFGIAPLKTFKYKSLYNWKCEGGPQTEKENMMTYGIQDKTTQCQFNNLYNNRRIPYGLKGNWIKMYNFIWIIW